MPTLSDARIVELLQPYLPTPPPAALITQLSTYLDLLLRWNARTNLTAIRQPEQIVSRHFGESLFAAFKLQPLLPPGSTLLDFGSGAGFPGLPVQLLLPHVSVTLAESQGKKAAFLREAVRTLNPPTEVWSDRVEAMPPSRLFTCVALRAVDNMPAALSASQARIASGGLLAVLGGEDLVGQLPPGKSHPIPGSHNTFLHISNSVPS